MKPTIKALEQRIEEHAENFGPNDYLLIRNYYHRDIVYLVDTSAPPFLAEFSRIDIKYLCKGFMGYYSFGTIDLGITEAKECGCKVGEYLCITFHIK